MMMDLFGTWSGLLSLIVILLSAVAIPAGVYIALVRQVKGPIELAAAPPQQNAGKGSEWRRRRYAH